MLTRAGWRNRDRQVPVRFPARGLSQQVQRDYLSRLCGTPSDAGRLYLLLKKKPLPMDTEWHFQVCSRAFAVDDERRYRSVELDDVETQAILVITTHVVAQAFLDFVVRVKR